MDEEAFYFAEGDRFRATELSRGPWDRDSQHAGPPTALLAREIERLPASTEEEAGCHLGRITYEILKPVPIAMLKPRAWVARPGRRVEMVEAELICDEEPVIRARGWRLTRRELELPPRLSSTAADGAPSNAGRPSGATAAPPPPEEVEPGGEFFETDWELGYHRGIEWRFVSGGFKLPGPAIAWLRPRVPLVAGEPLSPLQRVDGPGRLRQRHQQHPRPSRLPVHQRRFERPPAPPSRGRVGGDGCLDDSRADWSGTLRHAAVRSSGSARSSLSDVDG